MMLFSPTYLFLIPGGLLMILGLIALAALGGGPITVGGFHFDVHYMIVGSALTVLGFQIVMTGLFAKVYSQDARLNAPDRTLALLERHFSLERGLLLGALLFLTGFAIDGSILIGWLRSGMGSLHAIQPAIQASTLMILGGQTIFSSFFLGILELARPDVSAN
jgi:hypothetical protein